ncbi:MAG: alpha/beta fold hydrolase [Fimbriimonadaceae bacterium]|nr:alpha/beta fold hydrolase [Fimbriimonadaceae bacterium]
MLRSLAAVVAYAAIIPLAGALLPSSTKIERGAPLARKPAFGAALAPDPAGLKVVRTVPGTTAGNLGLQPNDLIKRLGGKPVTAPAQLSQWVQARRTGDPIEVEVVRGNETLKLVGKLQERPRPTLGGLNLVYDQVQSQGKRIRVIATHPQGDGPFPTLFVIGGIGAYSVDSEWESAPYGKLLKPLSQRYAIIRVEKPGQGDSEGPVYSELTFNQELDAYVQGLRLAKTFSFVDKSKLAIFGHSMGGTFGPLVAAQEPVTAVAVSGTLAKTLNEYLLENTRRQSLLAGAKAVEVEQSMLGLHAASHYILSEGMSPAAVKRKFPKYKQAVDEFTPDGKTMSGVGIPFWQQLAKQDVMGAWAKVNGPVLALWGENEFISTRSDHEYIAEAVNALRPGTAEFVVVPQSDHGFNLTTSTRDSLAKWGKPGSEFNPNIIEILGQWLSRTIG